jgi:glycosyltransferase involved in cell wall biosynthesis
MRILHLIDTARPESGGPIELARNLGIAWSDQGHRQDIVSLDRPGEVDLLGYPGSLIALDAARGKWPWQKYRYSPVLIPWLREHAKAYDIVLVSSLWRYPNHAARVALAKGPTPYFAFAHGMLDPWFRQAYRLKHAAKQLSWWLVDHRFLGDAAAVLFTTEEERQRARGTFTPYRLKEAVVGCGIIEAGGDPQAQRAAFLSKVPQVEGRRFLLFLGRLHQKKGCDLLIEAYARLLARHGHALDDLDLVVAGPDQNGMLAQLRAQSQALGVAQRVHFTGMIQGDAKQGAYRCAQAFVLPSHQENFGLVVAEALACGTPVLISNKVNVWREIETSGAGLVADDTLEGTERMLETFLHQSDIENSAMQNNARKAFSRHFDMATMAEGMIDLFSRHKTDRTAL